MNRIVFFTASTNIGGIERVFLTYANALVNTSYEIYYITCWDKGDLEKLADPRINIVCLGNLRLRYSLLKLSKILKEINPNFIITSNDATLIVRLSTWISFCKSKVITSQHSYYNNSESLLYSRFIIYLIFPLCDRIIAVSKGIYDMLRYKFRISEKKLVILNNPVDRIEILTKSEIETPDFIYNDFFLFVGRMTSVKNINFMLTSFLQYRKNNPLSNTKLLMIGDGPERNKIEELSSSLGLNNKVVFLGIKSNPYPFIKRCRSLLLTSTSEAFPTVLIEAMVLGKTSVSTPTLGAIDILRNGKLGYISSSFNDSEEFAKLMEKSVKTPIDTYILEQEVCYRYGIENKLNDLLGI